MLTEEWVLENDFIHLNHAAIGPWPKRTQLAIQDFAMENSRQGSWHYLKWIQTETRLRKQLQQLINASNWQDIALLKNTSEALSVIAYGLPWSPGDNIVISNEEFPSNYIVWESLKSKGVEIRYANLSEPSTTPEQALCDLCDKKTRLVSISSVQYSSGLRVNLNQLGKYCRSQQILFCVDAIQSIGAQVFDVQACQADFVVADGHKWMLGPEGVSLFYCNAKIRDRIKLNQFGWHMVENPSDFSKSNWKVANNALRFECGSPNMLGIHGLEASLSLLLEVGISAIETQIEDNTQYLSEQLVEIPDIELLSSKVPGQQSGIVSFKSNTVDIDSLFELLTQQKIFCAKRGRGIRFSAHYYTPKSQLDKVLNLINDYQKRK